MRRFVAQRVMHFGCLPKTCEVANSMSGRALAAHSPSTDMSCGKRRLARVGVLVPTVGSERCVRFAAANAACGALLCQQAGQARAVERTQDSW